MKNVVGSFYRLPKNNKQGAVDPNQKPCEIFYHGSGKTGIAFNPTVHPGFYRLYHKQEKRVS
jgi:hypothetical protein